MTPPQKALGLLLSLLAALLLGVIARWEALVPPAQEVTTGVPPRFDPAVIRRGPEP